MRFYSQYQQDKFLYENFFKNNKNGFFVDIGASDGVVFSNTKFFEDIGWNGICVEPRKDVIEDLKKNRNCFIENVCLSDSEEEKDFISVLGCGSGLSGLAKNCDLKRIFEGEGIDSPKNIERINCKTLNVLLDDYGIFHIDYLSIDIEGSEYDVLSVLNWDKYDIDFLTIENNNSEDNRIRKLLKSKGYDLIKRLNIDEVFKKIK